MFEVFVAREYDLWLSGLRDVVGRARISDRVDRLLVSGHWGDHKVLVGGIIDLRTDVGPGYRLYCKRIGRATVLFLVGGDKASQRRDIERAKELAKRWQA